MKDMGTVFPFPDKSMMSRFLEDMVDTEGIDIIKVVKSK